MNELARIPLFAALPPERSAALATRCSFHDYQPNELVIDYEELSDDVRFVLSGRVRILLRTPAGKEFILAELGQGEFFGEMAALDGSRRSANVTALDAARICTMPAAVFRDTVTALPEAALRVMQLLCERMRALNMRLSEHAFLTTRQRLCAELLRLSRARANRPGQRIVSPPPLQRDLADRIGTQREVVTRELSALKRSGAIEATRGGLVIGDPDRLNAIISASGRGSG